MAAIKRMVHHTIIITININADMSSEEGPDNVYSSPDKRVSYKMSGQDYY